jgi:magnesium-transporting ATPase (P-type)
MSNQTREQRPRWLLWIPLALAAVVAVTAIAARWWYRQRAARLLRERAPAPPVIPPSLRGLTEEEAQARRLEGQDNAIPFRLERSRKQILKENLLTIFNLNLVGLSFSQFLLGLPLDALISLGMIVLNAVLNIAQETIAGIRLKEVEKASRLQATVIRDGKVRSIDPNEIVLGDALVVGPGDYLLIDGELVGEGQIVVDESMLTGVPGQLVKRNGDKVYAGSFCVSGRAACEAQKVGKEREFVIRLAATEAGKEELTNLERVIDSVLKILLVIVAVFTVLILAMYFKLDLPVDVDMFASAISVIYSIAPASLFFMIFLTYAGGSADLAKLGALVNRTRSVESLAQATTLCFAKAGILTGMSVELERIEPPQDSEHLSASRIDQILGDYVRSTSVNSVVMRTMASTFDGSRRAIVEEAPFLSAFGWSAITFDDDDLRGVYVLGDPLILEEYLEEEEEDEKAEEKTGKSPVSALRKRLPSLGRLFRRSKEDEEEDEEEAVRTEEEKSEQTETNSEQSTSFQTEQAAAAPTTQETEEGSTSRDREPKQNVFRRLATRFRHALPGGKEETEQPETEEEPQAHEHVLLFAYRPEVRPLHAPDGIPQLPTDLIPLCRLHYSERVRPEAIETIQTFSETGVNIKVFTSSAPDHTAAILRQAGLGSDDENSVGIVSGPELAKMDATQLGEAVRTNTIFGYVSAEQTALVVKTLREQGHAVTVIGDGVSDVPSMRQANLSIAGHTSSQAALGVADIVLLKDSPKVLLDILNKGQRIANGLLDVLRLYLTQVFYVALLIVVITLIARGFPYSSKQGSIIAIVTLSIPSVALSLWAAPGQLPTKDLRRLMARFVTPAVLTISAAGLVVYVLFHERTGDREYTQLVLTYALVAMGLFLVLFLRPPTRLLEGAATQGSDRRFVVVTVVLLFAFLLVSMIPLTYQLFMLKPLRQALDYAIVGVVVLGWAVSLRIIWWVMPLATKVERAARTMRRRPEINERS